MNASGDGSLLGILGFNGTSVSLAATASLLVEETFREASVTIEVAWSWHRALPPRSSIPREVM